MIGDGGGKGVQPWGAVRDALDGRRRELFSLAAPVFRAHGYRGTTIAQLAHACHLSPAGLYHYFGSKAEFATYLVRQPHLDWDSVRIDETRDAHDQLIWFIDLAIHELPAFLVALSLAAELDVPGLDRQRRALFTEGEAVFGRFIGFANPALTRHEAREAGRTAVAVLVGSEAIADDAAAMHDRIWRVLATYGIGPERPAEPKKSGA